MTDLVAGVTVTASAVIPDDTVTLKTNGRLISGWDAVEITAGAESVPRSFEVSMTALQGPVAQAGDPFTLQIGNTTVVTGHIDRDTEGGSGESHRLSLVGRGLCADLVDCSAEWDRGQIVGANALEVATKLAAPYGISVYAAPGTDLGPAIPQFNLNFGETAYAIIERITRYAGQLAYEDEFGNLALSQVGTAKAIGGVIYGQNVLSWNVINSMDGRFSDYAVTLLAINTIGAMGPLSAFYKTSDPNVRRHRLKYLVVEAVANGPQLCQRRADWEASRAAGRGTLVTATVDSWRDAGGTLWTPNTLVPVTVPGFRLPNNQLVLSEVTFRYSEETGKVADLTLMPPSAFALEPVVLQPSAVAAAISAQ